MRYINLRLTYLLTIKTWWYCVKEDTKSLGLSQENAQSRNKWRRRIEGLLASPGSLGKIAVTMAYVKIRCKNTART